MGEEKSLTPSHGRSQLGIGKVFSEPLFNLLERKLWASPDEVLEACRQCRNIDEADVRIIRWWVDRCQRWADEAGEDLTIRVGGEYHGTWLFGDQSTFFLYTLREVYDLGAGHPGADGG